MNRFVSRSARWLPIAVATGMALIVPAQVVGQQEQPILFSSPDSDDIGTNMPSLTPRPPTMPEAAQAFQASSFDFNPASDAPTELAMPLSPEEVAQMQKQLDEKENWALLTPQELLGVPTPQKIMGLPENENESVTERYLERQETPVTNEAAGLSQWDVSADESNSAAATVAVFGSANPAASSFFSQMMGNSAPGQGQNTGNWSFSFGSGPAAPSQPTPEQVAEAEAFQKMITFHSSASLPSPTEPLFNANPFDTQSKPVLLAAQPVQDTLTPPPQFNPLGASFTPLNKGVHMPVGVKPLPGLIPQNLTPIAPEWKPQLPPWMSPVPEPGQIH
jgi:hypothetical protein